MEQWITLKWITRFVRGLSTLNAFTSFGTGPFVFWKNEISREWTSIKNGVGGRGNILWGSLEREVWGVLEKMGMCRRWRLHACIASVSNIENKFIRPAFGRQNFKRAGQVLQPHPGQSMFRTKVYFTYPCIHDPSTNAQTTLHSFDFPEERNTTGVLSKPLESYNGYIFQVRFLYRLYLKNQLGSAKIYNNQSPGREKLKEITPENILGLMQGLA